MEYERAGAFPLGAVHAFGVGLYALCGAIFIAVMLLGPTLHGAMGDPLTSPRVYASGLGAIGTVVAIGFSTGLTIAAYRVSGLFRKWSPSRQRAAMFAGLVVAHGLGCLAAVGVVGAAITTTLLG